MSMSMKGDVESGESAMPLYPSTVENPQLRWSFIRKRCSRFIISDRDTLSIYSFSLFSVGLAIPIGLTCTYTSGKIILEAVILTTVVVLSLTLYTFWASRKAYDFNFLGRFLFGALLLLIGFGLIQILFPMGKLSHMIYGCLGSTIFCGYVIYNTDNLIKEVILR